MGYPRFFDISGRANPRQLSTFELGSTRATLGPGFFTVHDPKVRGDLVFFSWYAEGVVVVDIADPANPRQVAQFVPEPTADPQGFFFPGERRSRTSGGSSSSGTSCSHLTSTRAFGCSSWNRGAPG